MLKVRRLCVAGGYVRATVVNGTTAYSYVYNYTDHLGNIRLSYAQDPASPTELKILEENHYYPYGLKHTNYNSDLLVHMEYRGTLGIKDPGPIEPLVPVLPYNYKYSGKELQDEMGLNTYAYGWRDYDPAIGRFHKIDRFAEKYYKLSPYGFTANNPVYFMEIQGDSINVAKIKEFDTKNQTNYLQSIIDDLNSQTGLTLIVNSNGQLIYQTNANGDAVISTTIDSNGNTTQNGSAEARKIMMFAISSTNQLFSRIATTGRTGVPGGAGGSIMNLVPSQINEHINGARNVDNRTLGWGMTFMHEVLHSNVADGGAKGHGNEKTFFGSTGDVVKRMNIVRSELNSQGMNYGQRESYIAVPDYSSVTPTYLPFDKTALSNLKNGNAPNVNTMYIQIN